MSDQQTSTQDENEERAIMEREAKFAAITKEVHDIIAKHQLDFEGAFQVLGRGIIMLTLSRHAGDKAKAAEMCRAIGETMSALVLDPSTEVIHHQNG